MSEKVKSIFLDNTTVFGDSITDHDLTTSWKTVFGADNPNINNDSLVAYWRLDDVTGNDSSGNGHNITWSPDPDVSQSTPFKNKNNTVLFDGISNYGKAADSSDLSFGDSSTDQPFSISFWIKPGEIADGVSKTILIKNAEYELKLSNNKLIIKFYDFDLSNYMTVFTTGDVKIFDNIWTHISIAYNGAVSSDDLGISLFINGELISSDNLFTLIGGSYTAMHPSSNDLYVCWIGMGTSSFLPGEISELAIWNRELTATEAKALHDVRYGVVTSLDTYSSYSPRLMLRDADDRRGQYPTVRRTGDKDRSGSFNIQFNDENTVEFKKIPTVYPGEKDQSFSITDGGMSYTYSSQDNLVAHWRPQDINYTSFTLAGMTLHSPVGAYIENKVKNSNTESTRANLVRYQTDTIQEAGDPRHTDFTERDGKIYEARGTRNSYKYLFQDATDDGLNIGTAETWDAIIGDNTTDGSTQKMTFSVWIYKTGDGGTNIGTILDFGSQDISLWSTSTEELVFNTKWDGNKKIVWTTAPGVFSLNTWTHISITYDATNALNNPSLYIDGILTSMPLSSGVQTGAYYGIFTPSSQNGFIGNAYALDRGWEGNIADVAIWNSLLSADEVKALYLNDTRWNPDITSAQEVQYPIGLLKDDSRLPELTPDITSKGLVTRSHGGESFSIITDGEDISAYNDELDKTQDTDFYNVGTDREVYPGFSSPLRSKTSFTFDITATEEQYVFRQNSIFSDENTDDPLYDATLGSSPLQGEDFTGFCYYAFGKNKWEQIGLVQPETGNPRPFYYGALNTSTYIYPDLYEEQNTYPGQFMGNSGFSLFGGPDAPFYPGTKKDLGYDKIGLPTVSNYAPMATQYHATSSQILLTDTFIDNPFLLEKISLTLPIYARHMWTNVGDKTREQSTYMAFLYLQKKSINEETNLNDSVKSGKRSLIASASINFYNNSVLVDSSVVTRGVSYDERAEFFPINEQTFSHEFDTTTTTTSPTNVLEYDGTIKLEFKPSIANAVSNTTAIPAMSEDTRGLEHQKTKSTNNQEFWPGGSEIERFQFGSPTGGILYPAAHTHEFIVPEYYYTSQHMSSWIGGNIKLTNTAGQEWIFDFRDPSTPLTTSERSLLSPWISEPEQHPTETHRQLVVLAPNETPNTDAGSSWPLARELHQSIDLSVGPALTTHPLTYNVSSLTYMYLFATAINQTDCGFIASIEKNYYEETDPTVLLSPPSLKIIIRQQSPGPDGNTSIVWTPGSSPAGHPSTTNTHATWGDWGNRLSIWCFGMDDPADGYVGGMSSSVSPELYPFPTDFENGSTTISTITGYEGENKSDVQLLELNSNILEILIYGARWKAMAGNLSEKVTEHNLSKVNSRNIKTFGSTILEEVSADESRDTTAGNGQKLFNGYLELDSYSRQSPFLLMPGDELILGIEKTSSGDRIAPGVSKTNPHFLINTYELGLESAHSLSGSLLKIKAEPASMTLYGSLMKENKEYHNTLNQDLTSNSVHEAFYGDPVLDQFEIDNISDYARSTNDQYVEGDMNTLSLGIPIGERQVTKRVSDGDVEADWSLTRFNTYSDELERYYDTLLPDVEEYASNVEDKYIKAGIYIGSPSPAENYLISYTDDSYTTPVHPGEAWWTSMKNFPFHNTESRTDMTQLGLPLDTGTYGLSSGRMFFDINKSLFISGIGYTAEYDYYNNTLGWDPPLTYVPASNDPIGGCLGFKYGVRNVTPVTTTSIFRNSNYGQFRDMLEQRKFGRFYKSGNFTPLDPRSPGFSGIQSGKNRVQKTFITPGPLGIKFVQTNSTKVTQPEETNSSNLSLYATSSLPFFDDIDTYNGGNGRNRTVIDASTLSSTVIGSSAILDFDFDPSDLL